MHEGATPPHKPRPGAGPLVQRQCTCPHGCTPCTCNSHVATLPCRWQCARPPLRCHVPACTHEARRQLNPCCSDRPDPWPTRYSLSCCSRAGAPATFHPALTAASAPAAAAAPVSCTPDTETCTCSARCFAGSLAFIVAPNTNALSSATAAAASGGASISPAHARSVSRHCLWGVCACHGALAAV